MRISSQQVINAGLTQILQRQQEVSQVQQQIATGKRVNSLEDDPLGAGQITLLQQAIGHTESLKVNADQATSQIELAENVLQGFMGSLQRVRELSLQANNSSLSDSDRAAITAELQQRLQEAVGYANTQDSSGTYLFSGFQTQVKPYTLNANGAYQYNGDSGQRAIEIASGIQQTIADSGFDIFEDIKNGNGTFRVTAGNNTGTAVAGDTQVSNSSAYVPDQYTLSFVTNGSGQLAYQVMGASSGQVIPAPPAVTPASAPAYTEGQAISFNGIEIILSGAPAAGDNFSIQPSQGENIFSTIQGIISALSGPSKTPSNMSAMQNKVNDGLMALDQGINSILLKRTQYGSRLNTVESAKEMNEDFLLHSKTTLSSIVDLDIAAAATQLSNRAAALEAAQKSFVRIQNLSVFNYL